LAKTWKVFAFGAARGIIQPSETNLARQESQVAETNIPVGRDVQGNLVVGDHNTFINQTPPVAPPPAGSAPPPARTAHYVRRTEIEDKVRAALQAQTSVAVVGVAGMGGIGKTELARFLANEFAKTHRVIWVGVYNRSLGDAQAELGRALGITFAPNADDQSRYETLLGAFHTNPHIVVFDDVYRSAIPHLKLLLPPSPPCAALITSRQRELGVARVFELDVMSETQALELVREAHTLGDVMAREPAAAQTLCELCGYLPLALDIAASRLRKQLHFSATPLDAFNRALANRLQELQRGNPDRLNSITANLDLSYNDLSDDDQRRLRALAVFAPSGFAPRAAGALWNASEADARTHIERLQDESLVMNAKELGRFRLHDLVRDYAAQKLNDCGESDAANRAHAEFLIALFEKHYSDDPTTAPDLKYELENLRVCANWARDKKEARLLALLVTQPRNWFYVIFDQAWNDWYGWLQDALRVGEDYEPGLRANVLQAIGDVQQFRDERDAALKSYAHALELFRSVGDRLGEANVLQAIGDVQRFRKENDAALKSYAHALELFRSVGARLGEANVLKAIGDIQQFRKENDAALKSYAHALELFRSVGDRLGEANVLQAIGDIQQFRKENDAALKSYAHALELFRSVGARLGEANILLSLGAIKRASGNILDARADFQNAFKMYRNIGDAYSQARALYRLGDCAADEKNWDDALQFYRQAADLWSSIGMTDLVQQILTPRIQAVENNKSV
jgi:tetratricopeptide (TPR) repeat protein